MDFLGIGMGEVVLILFLALLIFGPERLPQIARTMGKFARYIRQISTDFTTELSREADAENLKTIQKDISQAVKKSVPEIEVPHLDTDLAQIDKELDSPPAKESEGRTGIEGSR